MKKAYIFLVLLLPFLFAGCKDDFNFGVQNVFDIYLILEGVTESDITVFCESEKLYVYQDKECKDITNEGIYDLLIEDELINDKDHYVPLTLKNKKSELEKKIESLRQTFSKMEDEICFDNLGIDRLFIDEAHNYKNLPIKTRINNCLGLNSVGSQKCQDLYDKIQVITKNNGGVIFATGTPITNSITDIYVMQKYLQNDLLKVLEINTFDQWAGLYTERKEEFEIDVDTTKFRMCTRLSKFHNIKELTTLFSNVSDFYHKGKNSGLPDFNGYNDIRIKKTLNFEKFLSVLSGRADMVRRGDIEKTQDNMLNISIDGRKGALDLRLLYPNLPFDTESKVYYAAEKIYEIYMSTKESLSTQLVFSDVSTPKTGTFNIYDELTRLLVLMGVKRDDIAYIHDAKSDDEKLELYDDMNLGNKRILIGSTFKVGIGVNIQNKLIAIHHLDVPWRPSDMVQREGRILRQGNENKEVFIYRYITEGSFDAYSWQLLETKERFIESILEGTYDLSLDESNLDTALNYAEVKALAIGNPIIKRRVEIANELERIISIDRTNKSTRLELESEKITLPKRISDMEEEVKNIILDEMNLSHAVTIYSPKEKSDLLNIIIENLASNILKDEDTNLFKYQGFMLVLPKNMLEERPYLYLKNNGTYRIDFQDLNKGIMIRIDNFIDKFHTYAIDKSNELENLKNRYQNLDFELSQELVPYQDKILELETLLKNIDQQLGVTYE